MMQSADDKYLAHGKLSVLIAAASILQISESMLPHPLPGLRFGLANIVSLIVLIRYGFRPALTITIIRTIVTSFIMGSFLSPGFALSLCGGFSSICVVGLIHRLSKNTFLRFSPIGLGIIGAFIHNMVQLMVAYLIIFTHPGIFFMIPWLSFGSVALGAISGLITLGVLKQLANNPFQKELIRYKAPVLEDRVYVSGNSWLHSLSPVLKIVCIFILSLITILVENLYLYAFISIFLAAIIPSTSLGFSNICKVINRLKFIILSAFLFPLYFNSGNQVLFTSPFGSIYLEAVETSLIFSSRILILAVFTSMIAKTTTSKDLANGICKIAKPLNFIGLNNRQIADTITNSIAVLPGTWADIRSLLEAIIIDKPKNFNAIKKSIIEIFVYLFTPNTKPID